MEWDFRHGRKRPVAIEAVQETVSLPTNRLQYAIPASLLAILNVHKSVGDTFSCLLESTTVENYAEREHLLLHLEEFCERICGIFIAQKIRLYPCGDSSTDYFFQTFKTLRIGQRVLVECVDERTVVDAKIIRASGGFNVIYISRLGNFIMDPELQRYNIRHIPRRHRFRCLHSAVDKVWTQMGADLLFGIKKNVGDSKEDLDFLDKGLDKRQRQVVSRLVLGEPSPVPYIILGAAGTGKTRTLVELILHFTQNCTWSRVLVCGLTFNSTCQLAMCIQSSAILRDPLAILVSDKALLSTIDPCLREKSFICMVETLGNGLNNRLVFSTVYDAAKITENCRHPNFTHVILDDCGALTEPEALLPISCLGVLDDAQVVLAGDLAGLAPTVRSKDALKYGLGNSLIFRLMNHLPFLKSQEQRDGVFMTELEVNYRSSPEISEFTARFLNGHQALSAGQDSNKTTAKSSQKGFSSRFALGTFADETPSSQSGLVSPSLGASPTVSQKGTGMSRFSRSESSSHLTTCIPCSTVGSTAIMNRVLEKLPAVQFISVKGTEEMFNDLQGCISPWNSAEVEMVLDLLKKNAQLCNGIKIGIFSPFRGQLTKISRALKALKMLGPNVVDLEAVIGEEYDFMVISCVQSGPQWAKYTTGGFIGNPELSHFVVSRAKKHLVVIGNEKTLQKDDYWTEFIKIAKEKRCFITQEENAYFPPV